MYTVKPFNENVKIADLPTNMYYTKPYFSDASNQTTANNNNDVLADLCKKQQSQLNRLNQLKQKLNQFCEEKNLNHLIIESNNNNKCISNVSSNSRQPSNENNVTSIVQEQLKNKVNLKKLNKAIVNDLVIHADPQNVPYSLFILFNQLCLNYKCFIQFFTHGSLLNEFDQFKRKNNKLSNNEAYLKSLNDLYTSLKLNLNESRNLYDFGITFVWKKLNNASLGPILFVDSSKHGKIFGEANILRYFSRLLPSGQNFESNKDALIINEWINKCTNELRLSTQHNSYLNQLKHSLASKNYLCGDKAEIADFYNWSVLKQVNAKLDTKLSEWSKRIETSDPIVRLI